jgi:Putative peptidoglycan binding domain
MANEYDNPEDPFFDEHSEHKPEIPEETHEGQEGQGEDTTSSGESSGSEEQAHGGETSDPSQEQNQVHGGETQDPQEEQTGSTDAASEDHVDQTFEEETPAPEDNPAPEDKFKDYVQHVEEPEEDPYASSEYGDVQPGVSFDYGLSQYLLKQSTNPEYLREVAEWEAAQNAPLPMPADHFPDDPETPTIIAQGDTQTTTEATRTENVDSHLQTAQHDGHGEHQAKQEASSHQPKPAPELDAVGAGNAILKEGHQGEAVGEIQRLLGLDADGMFSADLAAQIAKFQEDEEVNPTGIVDQLTLQLLRQVEEERLKANQPSPPKTESRSFNLEVQEKQGFPQTPPVPETANETPVEKPQQEEQNNPLQQIAHAINEGELGFLDGYSTSILPPLDPEATQAMRDQHNNIPYVFGKTIADGIVQAQGVFEIIEGGIDILSGGTAVGIGLAGDSALETALGVATVATGVGLMGHGKEALLRGAENFGNDLQHLFNPMDGGGEGGSQKKLSGKQEAEAKGWNSPPDEYEWYRRKDGKVDVRRRAGEGGGTLPELQYNPSTGKFEVRDGTLDFKANLLSEEVVDVEHLEIFKEPLKVREEGIVKRDELEALKETRELSEAEKLELKEAIQKVQKASEEIGELGLRHFFEAKYPEYERIEIPSSSGGAKQGRFDAIYKKPEPPPEYFVGEGKGGDSPLGQRQVGEDIRLNAQQCTPEYNESIISAMERRGDPEADGLREAFEEGRLRTFKVQTPIENSGSKGQTPNLSVEKLEVSEYDMKQSIRVDKTVKPAKPQSPSP